MWRISTRSFVNRNRIVILPMPDEVITLLNAIAKKSWFHSLMKPRWEKMKVLQYRGKYSWERGWNQRQEDEPEIAVPHKTVPI